MQQKVWLVYLDKMAEVIRLKKYKELNLKKIYEDFLVRREEGIKALENARSQMEWLIKEYGGSISPQQRERTNQSFERLEKGVRCYDIMIEMMENQFGFNNQTPELNSGEEK